LGLLGGAVLVRMALGIEMLQTLLATADDVIDYFIDVNVGSRLLGEQ
jgi:hypothetical protein